MLRKNYFLLSKVSRRHFFDLFLGKAQNRFVRRSLRSMTWRRGQKNEQRRFLTALWFFVAGQRTKQIVVVLSWFIQ